MRSTIVLLLLGAAVIAGCDRQSATGSQANESANAAAAAEAPAGKVDRSHKGEAAPDIAFTSPDGKKLTLADFRGKPVLLNLWATWCAPCVKEMPTLDALAQAKGDALQVLTVSQDFEGKTKVDPYFAKAGFKRLKPYLDTEAAFSLGLGLNLPTTILFDAEGREVWRVTGEMDWSSTQAAQLLDV
ncbi:TlpA disulfide reductase family protein [Sphingomonas sp.]|uniref:TlpA family protein disulfide reductase n=1 Tax=Sphingomonas sp. TaxID=28214 RepID=UPI0025EF36DD|nr:TlpA disulfide reductase family protein [Sphingomonas sp.]